MASTNSSSIQGTSSNGFPMPEAWVGEAIRAGGVIPAHPLALTDNRKFDERRQRALARYYHASGVDGLAVGVHTTQFEIRLPEVGLLKPVLELGAETIKDRDAATGRKTVLLAGICGQTAQAVSEARLARELGYHIGMVSLSALSSATDEELIAHCTAIAAEIPIFGFYMQSAVGGRELSRAFWRQLATIPNLVGVKIAPFDRYKTLDVVLGIAESGRSKEVALYTGNDDNIVLDLLTEYDVKDGDQSTQLRIVGGLLGHWACWTSRAVELLKTCKSTWGQPTIPAELLTLAAQVTDSNAALFDARNKFRGCIVGIHYALQQQGLLSNLLCLEHDIDLTTSQRDEIDRVRAAYPHLVDDEFVREHLDEWLS